MNQSNNQPASMVSVCMITYNHEDYIRDAIDGVLMQKTNFPIKLIIGEDYSTDKTLIICKEYQQKYPEIIELLPSTGNIGMMPNFIRTINACTGKYIALCEGDDYWTDPLKLQKQVDFLEENEEYSICAHQVNVLNDDNSQENYYRKYKIDVTEEPTLEDLSKQNLLSTTSVVFRKNIEVLNAFNNLNNIKIGDYVLHLLNACHGNIKIIPETMAHYRIHNNGVWQSIDRVKQSSMYLETLQSVLDCNYIKNPKAICNLKAQAAIRAWFLYKNCSIKHNKVSYLKICANSNAEFLHEQFENKGIGLKRELKHFLSRQIKRFKQI
jgi:glycosyltransferase involved in cell wall biosynthesis